METGVCDSPFMVTSVFLQSLGVKYSAKEDFGKNCWKFQEKNNVK